MFVDFGSGRHRAIWYGNDTLDDDCFDSSAGEVVREDELEAGVHDYCSDRIGVSGLILRISATDEYDENQFAGCRWPIPIIQAGLWRNSASRTGRKMSTHRQIFAQNHYTERYSLAPIPALFAYHRQTRKQKRRRWCLHCWDIFAIFPSQSVQYPF